jgi:hypothetical protein
MEGICQNPGTRNSKWRVSPVTIVIAAVAILAAGATLWFLFQPGGSRVSAPAGESSSLKMNPAEQEYAKKIEIGNIALSRAENFLHQEVTILSGEVFNGGTEPVSSLRLTTEFFDELNQVVLRETRGIFGAAELPLAPGERRAFEISFEHVPASWNMQQPAVRVSYLRLRARK